MATSCTRFGLEPTTANRGLLLERVDVPARNGRLARDHREVLQVEPVDDTLDLQVVEGVVEGGHHALTAPTRRT